MILESVDNQFHDYKFKDKMCRIIYNDEESGEII
jgi:hypothetical protein